MLYMVKAQEVQTFASLLTEASFDNLTFLQAWMIHRCGSLLYNEESQIHVRAHLSNLAASHLFVCMDPSAKLNPIAKPIA